MYSSQVFEFWAYLVSQMVHLNGSQSIKRYRCLELKTIWMNLFKWSWLFVLIFFQVEFMNTILKKNEKETKCTTTFLCRLSICMNIVKFHDYFVKSLLGSVSYLTFPSLCLIEVKQEPQISHLNGIFFHWLLGTFERI